MFHVHTWRQSKKYTPSFWYKFLNVEKEDTLITKTIIMFSLDNNYYHQKKILILLKFKVTKRIFKEILY